MWCQLQYHQEVRLIVCQLCNRALQPKADHTPLIPCKARNLEHPLQQTMPCVHRGRPIKRAYSRGTCGEGHWSIEHECGLFNRCVLTRVKGNPAPACLTCQRREEG